MTLDITKDNIARLGDLVKKVLDSAGVTQRVKRQTAVAIWPEIVGPELAKVSAAIKVRKDTLVVKVESPCWRNELYFLKEEILQRIGQKIGSDQITDIIFC